VVFDHLAGELSLAPRKGPVRQPARSPFICSFRSGWRRVSVCSVHIYYGTSKPDDRTRVGEIDSVSKLLAERNNKRQNAADGEPESVVLLGDFNIFNRQGDKTSRALENNGFFVPPALRKLPGRNLSQDKYFDQIAFHDPKKRLSASKAGVFNFSQTIYGDNEAKTYESAMRRGAPERFSNTSNAESFYRRWRTFQISDHFPLWLELRTDFADAYLATVMRANKKRDLSPQRARSGSTAR
jgi:exonuclease III